MRASILGGETLKIEGSGFEVPEGGEAKVEFYVGATRVKTVAVQPQGSSLIEFEAPDLSSLQSDIPDGKAALVLGVVVTITDEDGDEVKTKNNDGSNVYEALLPQVCAELRQRFGIGHATIQFETAEIARLCALRPDHVV